MSRRLGDRKSETEVALKGIKLARDGRRRLDDMVCTFLLFILVKA